MKLSFTSFLFLALLSLALLAGTNAPTPSALAQDTSTVLPAETLNAARSGPEQLPLPGPDLAVANWTSNRLRDPGVEAWSDPYTPTYWGSDAPGDTYHWFATQPAWPVKNGTYSAGLGCRAPNHHATWAYISQYGLGASMSNLTLRLDWYLDQNLDHVHDSFHLRLYLSDGSSGYYLYYYLNGTTTDSNSTSYGYYQLNAPLQQWNTFSRNLTRDFLAIPAFPKTIAPGLKLETPMLFLRASGTTNNLLHAFVDDVWLRAGTTTVIGGFTRDGNFENHNWAYWGTAGNHDASDLRQSPTVHGGTWSLNVTAASIGNQSYVYSYTLPQSRLTSLNPGWLSFWWRLGYTKSTPNSHAYVYLYCSNGTNTFWIYYLLGYGGTSPPWTNDSTDLTLHADQFNTTGTWTAFNRNIWQDAAAHFHTGEISVLVVYFEVDAHASGSRVVLLVDDAGFVSGAINGAGFEDQGLPGSQILGWDWTNTEFTLTSTAYAGSRAANLTLAGGLMWNVNQYLGWRPLDGTHETYLDVMWRLQAYTPNSNTYAYLMLTLADGHVLGYYLAASGAPSSNTTWQAWFNVTGVGTTGAWIAMHRDLVHDYQAVFGPLPNGVFTSITLGTATAVGPRLALLLDDLYLYDDPAPRISNVQRTPTTPGNLQAVQVTATIIDQDLAGQTLHYRLNSSAWQHVSMTPTGGDGYQAAIPGQPYGTVVDYYLTADDTWGKTTTALNGGAYWTYTIPAATTTTTTTGPPIPGFPGAAILLACGAALGFSLFRRRRIRLA